MRNTSTRNTCVPTQFGNRVGLGWGGLVDGVVGRMHAWIGEMSSNEARNESKDARGSGGGVDAQERKEWKLSKWKFLANKTWPTKAGQSKRGGGGFYVLAVILYSRSPGHTAAPASHTD